MITDRDREVINFIEQFKIANTSTIYKLFYPSIRVAQNRLKTLVVHGELKRTRNHLNMEYFYYVNKPRQLRHSLLLTNFYSELSKLVDIIEFQNEFSLINGIRPDGFAAYKYRNKCYIAFIEIEISNKRLDINKYKKLLNTGEYKRYFPTFPKLIAITNKTIPNVKEFEIIQIKEDLSNINCLVQI